MERRRTTRWGGATLTVGSFTYSCAILVYVLVYGQPHGTGHRGIITTADSARHVQAQWAIARVMWGAEMVGAILMALAGFILMERSAVPPARIPQRLSWSAVALGGILLTVMYATILGSYPSATAAVDLQPAIFEGFRGAAVALFNIGGALVLMGLAAAFDHESSIRKRGAAKWAMRLGTIAALASSIQPFALVLGVDLMQATAPAALLSFVLASVLGTLIMRTPEATDPT